jgi:hypothetical protein
MVGGRWDMVISGMLPKTFNVEGEARMTEFVNLGSVIRFETVMNSTNGLPSCNASQVYDPKLPDTDQQRWLGPLVKVCSPLLEPIEKYADIPAVNCTEECVAHLAMLGVCSVTDLKKVSSFKMVSPLNPDFMEYWGNID